MRTLYIHIGLHKTASTFLQSQVFPFLKQTVHLQPYQEKKEVKASDFFKELRPALSKKTFLLKKEKNSEKDFQALQFMIRTFSVGKRCLARP